MEGNFIGTDRTGTKAVPNGGGGIGEYNSSSSNTIGGTSAGARNVISGNTGYGISMAGETNDVIEGNYIGVDATGNVALPNSGVGVSILATQPATPSAAPRPPPRT